MAKKEDQVRILSGMRPTGKLHIGHLHGVLNNWLAMQEQYQCFFFVADWHALTTNYESPFNIPQNITEMVLDWLSVGLDPNKVVLFVQSDVKVHAELHLLLSMITPLSWLERNPTYKEQRNEIKSKDLATYGFLGYPVLQAADIIIYKAQKVPVGQDQLPHLELTREITRRFNYLYKPVFPVPDAILTEVPKLPGLDGRKMSKSYGNAIFLSDTPDDIRKKISTIVTDVQRPRKSDPGDPEKRCVAFNLHKLYLSETRQQEIISGCKAAELGCVQCKKELAEAIIEKLAPIQARRTDFASDMDTVHDILKEGAEKAKKVAEATMDEVRSALWSNNQ